MMQRLRNKNTITTWLVVVSFAISLVTVLEGISILDALLQDNSKNGNIDYSSQIQVNISGSKGTVWDMDALLEGTKGIVAMPGVNMFFDDIEELGICSWLVLFTVPEPIKYPLKWGRLPDVEGAAHEIALPDFMEKYATCDAGLLSILVHGVEYKVVGLFDTSQNPNTYDFMIGYKSLPPDIQNEVFKAENITLLIRSDRSNVYESAQTIKNNIEKNVYNAIMTTRELKAEAPILQVMENSGASLFFSLYLFSLVNCMVATNYWIIAKRRDMAIRKAYGWSIINMVFHVTFEMAFNITVSVFLSACLIALLSIISPVFSIKLTLSFITGTFGLLLLTICISIIIPFIRIIYIKPAEGVS